MLQPYRRGLRLADTTPDQRGSLLAGMLVCALLLAIGVVILLASESTGLAALRIVAVGVLLAGAIGGGVRAGLASEPPALFMALAARFTHKLARVTTLVLLLPTALSLLLALIGALLRSDYAQTSALWMMLGAVIALTFFAVLAAALTLAGRALRVAEKTL